MFHQSFYSQSQQRPSFHNNHVPNHFFMPAHSSFYNHNSKSNLKLSRDFEHFTMPSHNYPFYDLTRWRQYMAKFQQQYRRTPAFHFQDKSTFYYMSDPIMTNDNRITIQLTKVHIGPNGDQQRIFVEQEFSNEKEYKNFVQNLKFNFEKTFQNHDENSNTNEKKPGVVVIEEPDEEPKIYEQHVYNEQYQHLPLISSCSTIYSNKPRKNKMKYHRQNVKSPSYTYHYAPPPRFQKENHFHSPLNQNFNENQNRSRFNRLKDQEKSQPFSQFRRTQQQQQPRIIAENLIFTNNKQQQIRVDRSKSECCSSRNRNKFPQFFHHRQRHHFTPIILPSTPRSFRNTQIPFRLFHFNHPNSNHF